MASNETVRNQIKEEYGDECMLTGLTCNEEKNKKINGIFFFDIKESYHHIKKAEHKGDTTIENGALLARSPHAWLHCALENKHPDVYDEVNKLLLQYKKARDNKDQNFVNLYEENVQPFVYKEVLKYILKHDAYKLRTSRFASKNELSEENLLTTPESCFITDIYFEDYKNDIFFENYEEDQNSNSKEDEKIYAHNLWNTSSKLSINKKPDELSYKNYKRVFNHIEDEFEIDIKHKKDLIEIYDVADAESFVYVTQISKEYFYYLHKTYSQQFLKDLSLYLRIILFYKLHNEKKEYLKYKEHLQSNYLNKIDEYFLNKLVNKLKEIKMIIQNPNISSERKIDYYKELNDLNLLINEISSDKHYIFQKIKK